MLPTLVQSAFGKLGGNFSKAFLGQPFRKNENDKSIVFSSNGNIYRLEGVLGFGGLSVVYKASSFSDGKVVALKLANLEKSPDAKELLEREAELMARLVHDNIVKLYESGVSTEGDPFIAMEVLEGQTLEQLLLSETILDLERVCRIALQVAAAVQHAHEQGVLHRDIKPSNIMVLDREGVESAVLFDFGISLSIGENGLSFDDSSSGSLLYASPEQLGDRGCNCSTDVYQLALVMFEAITGRLPFEISISGALAYRRGSGPVLLSDEELGEQSLPPAIRTLLEKALERDMHKRTPDMASFISQLSQALADMESWSCRKDAA